MSTPSSSVGLATSVFTAPPGRLNAFSIVSRRSAGTWAVCSSAVTIAKGRERSETL